MSTDLYRVRVLDLDPTQRKVTFRVFLVYYDWSGVPTDPSFFFRILWDEADARFGGGGPLGQEVDVRQYLDEKWVNEHTQRFVEHVTRLALRNDPLPPGKTPPTFVYDGYTDEDGLTQGDFEVVVTDERWLAHLKVGQTWQTTSYETRAEMPRGRETLFADQGEVRGEMGPPRKKNAMGAKKPPKVSAGGKKTAKAATKKTTAKKAGGKTTAKKVSGKTTAKKTAKSAGKKTAKSVGKKAAKSAVKKTAKAAAGKKTAKNAGGKKTAKSTGKKTAKTAAAAKSAGKKTAKSAAKKPAGKKTAKAAAGKQASAAKRVAGST